MFDVSVIHNFSQNNFIHYFITRKTFYAANGGSLNPPEQQFPFIYLILTYLDGLFIFYQPCLNPFHISKESVLAC